MAIGLQVRKFLAQVGTALYEIILSQDADDSISGVARLIGDEGVVWSNPQVGGDQDDDETAFVVVTASVDAIFATSGADFHTDEELAAAEIYHATDPAETPTTLDDLLS